MTEQPDAFARLERHLGWLLIAGLATSAALLALGLLVMVMAPLGTSASHLLAAGLLVLIATPMLRVVVSMVEYIRLGEWFFVMTTLVVCVELAAGVLYALKR